MSLQTERHALVGDEEIDHGLGEHTCMDGRGGSYRPIHH